MSASAARRSTWLGALETVAATVSAALGTAVLTLAWLTLAQGQPASRVLARLAGVGAVPSEEALGAEEIRAVLATQAAVLVVLGGLLGWRGGRLRAGWPRSGVAAAALWGAGAGVAALAMTAGASLLLRGFGLELQEQRWVLALLERDPDALRSLSAWIVVAGPVAEEVFFRGYVFRLLFLRAGACASYLLSATLFAAAHFHFVVFPVYVLYGLLLAHAYRRTGRLLAPVVGHVTINAVALASLLATWPPPA